MDISSAFISDEQAPVSMEPGKGSLNNPAVLSKMRGTVHPTSGNAVLYMSHGARLSAKRKIVPFISVKFLRMTSGSPVQISQGRQMIQRVTPKFCVKSNECRNRANLYVGGSGLTVCRLCLQHNAGGDGCQGRRSRSFNP